MFAAYYGLPRKEALRLKHWEFEQYRRYYHQQKARDALSSYQCTGLAFGGSAKDSKDYIEDLRVRAGYSTQPLTTPKDTGKMPIIFADVIGVLSSEDYKRITNTPHETLTTPQRISSPH